MYCRLDCPEKRRSKDVRHVLETTVSAIEFRRVEGTRARLPLSVMNTSLSKMST